MPLRAGAIAGGATAVTGGGVDKGSVDSLTLFPNFSVKETLIKCFALIPPL
jgi:hypothetical protein